jgi:uncharacterized OB-fold protein
MESYVIVLFVLAGIGIYLYSKNAAKKVQAVKCPNCGATLDRGQAFCPHCGKDMTIN